MDDSTQLILEELHRIRGLELGEYRPHIPEKRVRERMAALHITEPLQYRDVLQKDPSECDRLIEAITIKWSRFFRNPMVFEMVSQEILPWIMEKKRRAGSREIRVWSAGCAGGEEVYSAAILIHQAVKKAKSRWDPMIFATDISDKALKDARAGSYSRESLVETKLGILDRYFRRAGDRYEVRPFVKKMVRFSKDDLASTVRFAPADSIFGSFDLVLCRNILIYFSLALQGRVLEKLHRSLSKGGYLILGDSDGLNKTMEQQFNIVNGRNRVFRKP